MANANDNLAKKKAFRDHFQSLWAGDQESLFIEESSLDRLAEARNLSSLSGNRFVIIASIFVILYFLRLEGLGSQFTVSGFQLGDVPFALFVFSASGLILSSIAQLRSGDSFAYDRYLKFACEKKQPREPDLYYNSYPNQYAWGQPFAKLLGMLPSKYFGNFIKNLSLILISLFQILIIFAPSVTGVDYLVNSRFLIEEKYHIFTFSAVLFLLISNILIFSLFTWIHLSDRE